MTPAIFGMTGTTLTQEERAFFKDADPAGYILFGHNVKNRRQVRALTDTLRAIHGREKLLIAVDQEGGNVARLSDSSSKADPGEWPRWPFAAEFGRLYDLAPASAIEAARANYEALGIDLAEVGITCTHAPVLDVRQVGAHDVIGKRSFGYEPMRVAALGRAALDGLARAGIVGTIKHMPGHGRAMADSHKELPTVTASDPELATDLAPFKALNTAQIGMTGHIVFTAWDADHPATQSPFVIEKIIRQRIGFDGLLLTDDLDMDALSGSVPERAEVAVRAGCDIALNCWGKMADMKGIASRLPGMSDATGKRLAMAIAGTGKPADIPLRNRLIANRDALLDLTGEPA